jgi:hypothetical protein
VHAARATVYAGLAGVAVAPLAAIARNARKPLPGETVYELGDKIFLKHAIVDLEDPALDGTRRIRLVCCWEDATGDTEDERREGLVVDSDSGRGRKIVWKSSEVLLPDPERWKGVEAIERAAPAPPAANE